MPVASKVSNRSNPRYIDDVSGVILAGGKSSRFGKNKALARINGTPLVEKVLGAMRLIFKHIVLITNTPEVFSYLDLPMYKDRIKGLGPIGGLFTGLQEIPGHAGFFVACDMPALNSELIRYMVENRKDYDVVVPRISGYMEALHALYTKGCLPAVKNLIDAREYQTLKLFRKVRTLYVEEDEIRAFDPQFKSFYNVNRPQELERFQQSRQ